MGELLTLAVRARREIAEATPGLPLAGIGLLFPAASLRRIVLENPDARTPLGSEHCSDVKGSAKSPWVQNAERISSELVNMTSPASAFRVPRIKPATALP